MNQFDPENLTRQPEGISPREPTTSSKKARIFPNENNVQDLVGFIQTLPEDPSAGNLLPQPRNFWEQVILVKSGGSTSVYVYDTANTAWRYVKLT